MYSSVGCWCIFRISRDCREQRLSVQCCISDGIPWNIYCTLLGQCQNVEQQNTQHTFLSSSLHQLETSLDSVETLMRVELDEEASCQVIMKDEELLMVKGGDDSAKFWWKECVVLRFLWGIRIHYTWLQGDKYYRQMNSRNGKLDQHNGCRQDSCKRSKIFQQQRVSLVVHELEQVV